MCKKGVEEIDCFIINLFNTLINSIIYKEE